MYEIFDALLCAGRQMMRPAQDALFADSCNLSIKSGLAQGGISQGGIFLRRASQAGILGFSLILPLKNQRAFGNIKKMYKSAAR